jgi:hypothetical protein
MGNLLAYIKENREVDKNYLVGSIASCEGMDPHPPRFSYAVPQLG